MDISPVTNLGHNHPLRCIIAPLSMRKETKKKSWIHGPLPIVNTEQAHSRHTEFTETSGLSFVGIALQWSFISFHSEQCSVVLLARKRIFWMDLTLQRQHLQLRKAKRGHLFPLLGSVWQWPAAAVFALDLPSSHPAHLPLTTSFSLRLPHIHVFPHSFPPTHISPCALIWSLHCFYSQKYTVACWTPSSKPTFLPVILLTVLC